MRDAAETQLPEGLLKFHLQVPTGHSAYYQRPLTREMHFASSNTGATETWNSSAKRSSTTCVMSLKPIGSSPEVLLPNVRLHTLLELIERPIDLHKPTVRCRKQVKGRHHVHFSSPGKGSQHELQLQEARRHQQ